MADEDWGYDDYQYSDYPGPTDSGQGGYRVGGVWYPIEAPGQADPQYTPQQIAEMNARAYAPTDYSKFESNRPGYYSQTTAGFGPTGYNFSQPQQPMRQQPSGGQRGMAMQTPQQITMGRPEDELYKRYKSLLMNPDFSGDPTYQFLYNQGLQALNRNLAAQRKTLSGQGMNDTMAYGAGMASKYMQDLFPQYRGGAQEELNRYMGPAGLLPRYAGVNNAAIGQANNMTTNADLMNSYGGGMNYGDLGLDRSGFTASGGSGIGWGGIRTQTNPGATGTQYPPIPTPRPLSSGGYDPFSGLDPEMMAELGMEE